MRKAYKYDFSNLANASGYENMDTAIGDLVRQMMLAIQSGDISQARGYVESDLFRLFLEELRKIPDYIATAYIYNCVAEYIAAMSVLSSYANAERLLNQATHAKISSLDGYLSAMQETVIAFTALVAEEKNREYRPGLIGKACAYIHDHIYIRFDLEELAAYCGCSLSYLRHRFKQELGQPLVGYIQAEKIAKARQLLTETDYTVAQIGSQLDFCSESYFITVFKKHVGCTPRQFKNQLP